MELIGLVATVIGIVSAVLIFKRWILPRRTAASESLVRALTTISYYFEDWQSSPYASKNDHIIPYSEFLEVDRHRLKVLAAKDDECRAYLMVCAVTHRKWGKWWATEYELPSLIQALSTLLNGRAGWRPIWRASYLLQLISAKEGHDWMKLMPAEALADKAVQEALSVIRKGATVQHLEEVSQGNNSHLRDKAFEILEDLRSHFSEAVSLIYPDPDKT